MQTSNGRTVLVQGRIVWTVGDLFKGRPKTDFNTKAPKLNAQGNPINEYGFGLAVPKSVLTAENIGTGKAGEIWNAIHEEAYAIYPSRQLPPSFAMKYKDGDGIDDKGIPFSQREGYANHLVFACTTTLPIKFFRWENNTNILINEGIKCGDYVNVQLNIKAHGAIGQGKPGLYLNPMAVQFLGYGKEIVNTPTGDAIFGVAPVAIPQGASATPLVSENMMAAMAAQTVQPVQPNWNVVPTAHQPVSTNVATQTATSFPAMPR